MPILSLSLCLLFAIELPLVYILIIFQSYPHMNLPLDEICVV
jgi:hypothetical protein